MGLDVIRMAYPLKGLTLHLHSALANQGYSQGINIIPVNSWFDLARKGHNGSLISFNFSQDKTWTGMNIPTDPYSLYFNGLNNHVVIPNHLELLPADSGFTFETWVKPVKSGYIASYGAGSERGFSLYFDLDTREIRVQITTETKKMSFVFAEVNVKAWQHVTLLYDGERLWGMINAAPQGFSLPVLGEYINTTAPLVLGKSSTANNSYFEGNIATFRIYQRALSWDEVTNSYNAGFLITDNKSELSSKGLVLWRDEIDATLNVSMMSRARAKYETAKVDSHNIKGLIDIMKPEDMISTIVINPSIRFVANYEIDKFGENDLDATISVTHFQKDLRSTLNINPISYMRSEYNMEGYGSNDLRLEIRVCTHNNLFSNISINPYAKLVGHYEIDQQYISGLLSEVNVLTYPAHLKSNIIVNMKEIHLTAKYETDKASYHDFKGAISVTYFKNLPSNIGVNINVDRLVRATYFTEPSYYSDLYSEIFVMGTNNLESSIHISTNSYVRATYGIDGITIRDFPANLNVRAVQELPSTINVTTRSSMRAQYGMSGIIIDDLASKITITSLSELDGTLTVAVKGIMSAGYEISPIFIADLPMDLGIKEWNELYGDMFINLKNSMMATYEIAPIYFEWLSSELSIRVTENLQCKMFVSKPFVLRASYGMMERPKFNMKLYPNKDAFVREFFPKLNYGSETQMYIGRTGSPFPEKYRSLVGFDISTIPTVNTEIGKAILRLYYDGRGQGSQSVQVTESNSQWNETGVTWANQPQAAIDGFSVTRVIGGAAGYVEFDVTQLVKQWHIYEKPNLGFLVRAIEESENLSRGFYTKEAIERRPELEVTYYDMQIYSDDHAYVSAEITIIQNKVKDLIGNILVRDNKGFGNLASSLHVHQPRELESRIWINHPQIIGSIVSRQKDFSAIPAKIAIKTIGASDLDGYIRANEIEKRSNIYVLYRNDLSTNITARVWGNPRTNGGQIASTMSITENNKVSSVYVLYRDDLISNFDIRVWSNDTDLQNNLLMEFEITRSFELPGSLDVKERVELDSTIGIRVEECTDQHSEMYVKYRVDLEGYGNIGNPNLKTYINVWEKSLLNGHVIARQNNENNLPATIYIPLGGWEEIPSSINLRMMYDVPGVVTVNSGNLQSFITIPINAQKNLVSMLNARVRRSSDLDSIFEINSGNFYSELTVRAIGHIDIRGYVRVKQNTEDRLPIKGYVRPWINLFSSITTSKPRYRDLASSIRIRQTGAVILENSIIVRVWGDSWLDGGQLDGTIAIRIWDNQNQESSISIRRSAEIGLNGFIQAKQVSDLPSKIAARQIALADLACEIACYDHFNLFGNATVRVWGDSQTDGGLLNGEITVRQSSNSNLVGLVEVFEHYSVNSTLIVRQSDKADVSSTIAVRRSASYDKLGTVAVRQSDKSDLQAYNFFVRQSDESQISVIALIKRVSNLESSVEVVTAYPYAYIM